MTDYYPFDQDEKLPPPPWSNADVEEWEAAHGHDARLKCYPEFGCLVIESSLEREIEQLKAELAKKDKALREIYNLPYEQRDEKRIAGEALDGLYEAKLINYEERPNTTPPPCEACTEKIKSGRPYASIVVTHEIDYEGCVKNEQ